MIATANAPLKVLWVCFNFSIPPTVAFVSIRPQFTPNVWKNFTVLCPGFSLRLV